MAGESRKGKRLNKPVRPFRHDDMDIESLALQLTHQLRCLVRRYAARDPNSDLHRTSIVPAALGAMQPRYDSTTEQRSLGGAQFTVPGPRLEPGHPEPSNSDARLEHSHIRCNGPGHRERGFF